MLSATNLCRIQYDLEVAWTKKLGRNDYTANVPLVFWMVASNDPRPVNQQTICDMTGLTSSTVSKTLHILNDGLRSGDAQPALIKQEPETVGSKRFVVTLTAKGRAFVETLNGLYTAAEAKSKAK